MQSLRRPIAIIAGLIAYGLVRVLAGALFDHYQSAADHSVQIPAPPTDYHLGRYMNAKPPSMGTGP